MQYAKDNKKEAIVKWFERGCEEEEEVLRPLALLVQKYKILTHIYRRRMRTTSSLSSKARARVSAASASRLSNPARLLEPYKTLHGALIDTS